MSQAIFKRVFERKSNTLKRFCIDSFGAFLQQHQDTVEMSFHVSLRIAIAKMPHTVAEELILSCTKDINWIMIGTEAENKLNSLSLLDNTDNTSG